MGNPTVIFEGIPSGDCECFCWDVTLETYKAVTGEEPEEYRKSIDHPTGKDREGYYQLYPGDVLRKLGVREPEPKMVKFTIIAENVDVNEKEPGSV